MKDFLDQMAEDASDKERVFKDLTPDELNSVSLLAQRQVELETEIGNSEERIKQLKKTLYKLSSDTLPQKMKELGIKGFMMDTGETLSIIHGVQASITAKNKIEAHKWLVDHGHGDLIKNTVTTKFAAGEENEAKAFVEELNSQGLNYNAKQAVHAMTLKAFVREQLEKGNPLDTELLGVFEFEQTKIVTPKKS